MSKFYYSIFALLLVSVSILPLSSSTIVEKPKFSIASNNKKLRSINSQTRIKFDVSRSTLGIRQKPRGRFVLVIRMPKIKRENLAINVTVDEQYQAHVRPTKTIFRRKRGKQIMKFKLLVKNTLDPLIPEGESIEVPLKIVDPSSGFEDDMTIIVRD